jgi:FAD/FMN-containing dehydrogenase
VSLINDASVYQLKTKRIDTPVSVSDLLLKVCMALRNQELITLRAGGTSLSGQATKHRIGHHNH